MKIRFCLKNVLSAFVLTLFGFGIGAAFAAEPENATPFADALSPFVESGDFPGAVVAVASPTEVLALETVGFADVATRKPIVADAYFWIASQSKAIVAAAAMILVDEGRLDLDAPVETYLPELAELKVAYPQEDGSVVLRAPKTKPTLRQALSHTAGFRFLTPFQESFGIDSLPVRKLMKNVATTPLLAEPGTRYSYSNLGIDVAQAAVEAVAGRSFEEFLQARIFEPLEMRDTTFYPTAEQRERLATPYAWDGAANKLKPIRFDQMPTFDDANAARFAEGGGGLFASIGDVVKFYQMLAAKGVAPNGKRILSEKAVAEMTTKQTPADVPDKYGFGLVADDVWFGHGGAYGTQGVVVRDGGFVGVYLVAVAGLPKQGEAEGKFRETFFQFVEKTKTEKK